MSWLFQVAFIVFLCCAAYTLWLDFRIQSEFEGKRWSLPARVYARPMEIYPGQELTVRALEKELVNKGYKHHSNVRAAGQYRRVGTAVEFIRRSFVYWDGREMESHLRVEFAAGQVSKITQLKPDQRVGLVRLEPQLIGKVYPSHNEDRALFPYDEIPQFLIDALIAVEDRHFFRHNGVDVRGIARALFANIRQGGIAQGGSTLTQQLVKNFFLTQERTFSRKFNELIMALLLERRYSKAEILSAYINEIYLGQHGSRAIHGFGTAAVFYFGQPLNELRDDQLALLVGLVRGASFYNPRRHPQRATDRRNLVLGLMMQQGYADPKTAEAAQQKPLGLSQRPRWSQAKYPAFLDYVKRQLLRDYQIEDLQSEGLRIFTTLDPRIQEIVEQRSARKLGELEEAKALEGGSLQMAAVIANIATGEVIALSGGRNKEAIGFNRALDAKRPVGSLIKPFVYLTALTQPEKYTVLTRIADEEISLALSGGDVWQPKNYDRELHGQVTVLEALSNSYNLATINLGLELGLDKVIATIRQTGFEGTIENYPSLLLGTLEMSPVEISQMYQVLANGGFRVSLNTIREVMDSKDRTLQRNKLEVQQVNEPGPIMLINYLLTQAVEKGTGRDLNRTLPDKLPVAGKTGTTNSLRDSWFIGYGDDLLATVWLGRDDNQPSEFTGAAGAMQIWADIIHSVEMQSISLPLPPGVNRSEELSAKYEGECITLSGIPYIAKDDLSLQDDCGDSAKKKSPLFNIFKWFE